MRLCKCLDSHGESRVGIVADESVQLLKDKGIALTTILDASDPLATVRKAALESPIPLSAVRLIAPIDQQEVWAAGVTYKRSQKARMDESERAASFYDLVYSAPRPELFFKATPSRVVGPGESIRVREDTQWSVPEPELTLVLSSSLKLVGFTIGNDMSARDIEGENPLYLPQAKVYRQCAGLGPVITLASAMPPKEEISIELTIARDGAVCFQGETKLTALHRTFEDLIDWLARDNVFPNGVFLMTGTGIVPEDTFTLAGGDLVTISITGIGTLRNTVVQG